MDTGGNPRGEGGGRVGIEDENEKEDGDEMAAVRALFGQAMG
jgi:hypothetical protein